MLSSYKYITKKTLISLFAGIAISLTLTLSYSYTAYDNVFKIVMASAITDKGAKALYQIWIMLMNGGYGFFPFLIAGLIGYYIFHFLDDWKNSPLISKPLFLVLTFLFGILSSSAVSLYWTDSLLLAPGIKGTLFFIILVSGWSFIFVVGASAVFQVFQRIETASEKDHNQREWSDRKVFIAAFLAIAGGWAVWVIPYYPGSMDNDVFAQLRAWLEDPNSWHPWFTSCILGKCYEVGVHFGSENFGIFLYVLIRDLFGAAVLAACVVQQKKLTGSRMLCIMTVLYFAFTPVWGAYAKHAFKDTLSSYASCLFVILTIQMARDACQGTFYWKNVLLFSVSGLLVCLTRNEGVYCAVPTSLIMAIICMWNRERVKAAAICMISVLLFFAWQYTIQHYCHVRPPETKESLSIPLQQTARTVRDHEAEITDDERAGISGLLQYELLGSQYNPILSDPVKGESVIKEQSSNMLRQYLTTWFRMGWRFPESYFQAFIAHSSGYYAFIPNLPEQAGNWNSGMTIFDWIGCNGDYDENFDFHYLDGAEAVRQRLHLWAKVWDHLPVFSITDVCAVYTWLTVLLGYYLIRMKHYYELIPVFAVLCRILTILLSPVNDCFRYYSNAAICFPALLSLLGDNFRRADIKIV